MIVNVRPYFAEVGADVGDHLRKQVETRRTVAILRVEVKRTVAKRSTPSAQRTHVAPTIVTAIL